MATKKFRYPPIKAGYPWSVQIRVISSPPKFPEGVRLKADVRTGPNAPALATLTTENGGLVRVDDERVKIAVTAAQSAKFAGTFVVTDLVRTDGPEPVHLNVGLRMAVTHPVTRNG